MMELPQAFNKKKGGGRIIQKQKWNHPLTENLWNHSEKLHANNPLSKFYAFVLMKRICPCVNG